MGDCMRAGRGWVGVETGTGKGRAGSALSPTVLQPGLVGGLRLDRGLKFRHAALQRLLFYEDRLCAICLAFSWSKNAKIGCNWAEKSVCWRVLEGKRARRGSDRPRLYQRSVFREQPASASILTSRRGRRLCWW